MPVIPLTAHDLEVEEVRGLRTRPGSRDAAERIVDGDLVVRVARDQVRRDVRYLRQKLGWTGRWSR